MKAKGDLKESSQEIEYLEQKQERAPEYPGIEIDEPAPLGSWSFKSYDGEGGNEIFDETPNVLDYLPTCKRSFYDGGYYFSMLFGYRGRVFPNGGTLYVRAKAPLGVGYAQFQVTFYNGETSKNLGTLTVSSTSYTTFALDISHYYINDFAHINNAKIKFTYTYCYAMNYPRVTYAYLRVKWYDIWDGSSWTEDLFVNGYDGTFNQWSHVGTSPYINTDDGDTSYTEGIPPATPTNDGYYTFTDTTETDEEVKARTYYVYSSNGRDYSFGGTIPYDVYGAPWSWYDYGSKKVYTLQYSSDTYYPYLVIGSRTGITLSFSSPKLIMSDDSVDMLGICKTSNGRLWIIWVSWDDYKVHVSYSTNEGDSWTSVLVPDSRLTYWAAIVPLSSSSVYLIYESSGYDNVGRTWNGTSFGSVEFWDSEPIYDLTCPVVDGAGRVHMLYYVGNAGIYHNVRSTGGVWGTPELLREPYYYAVGLSLSRNRQGTNVTIFYLDYDNVTGLTELYKRELDETMGNEEYIGVIDAVDFEYEWDHFRTSYFYKTDIERMVIDWQIERLYIWQLGTYTAWATGQGFT